MDQLVTIQTLIISVATSFFGSLIFFWYLKGREMRIKTKIADLQYEEEFLEKIKKGNIELIRSGFRVVSFSLFLVFSSGAALIAVKVFPMPQILIKNIFYTSIAMWATAAAVCFSYYRSLARLKDLPAAKEKIASKRQKLESKL